MLLSNLTIFRTSEERDFFRCLEGNTVLLTVLTFREADLVIKVLPNCWAKMHEPYHQH